MGNSPKKAIRLYIYYVETPHAGRLYGFMKNRWGEFFERIRQFRNK
jgi:hypothetical protein